ncbi:MAG TPA: DNA gyrase/topoisomerase IV subunit A, partial [Sphingobacteriaceae bacterium]
VFKKNDERTVYNLIYKDGQSGTAYVKRFSVLGVTRDKEYDLTKGSKGSKMLYFTANPNGEAEVVNIQLKPHSKLRKLQMDIDFAEVAIKGRGSQGNIVTKYPVKKVTLKSKGVSTLAGRKIWFDDVLKRLNADARGKYLGEFDGDDKILTVNKDGVYELTSFDLSNHFDDHLVMMEKYEPEKVYTVVHFDGKSKNHLVKRFTFENIAIGKKTSVISEEPGSKMILISGAAQPVVSVDQLKGKSLTPETIELNLADVIDVKGMKAQGNRLTQHEVKTIELIAEHDDPEDVPDPVPEVSLEEIVEEDRKDQEAEKEIVQPDETETAIIEKAVNPETQPAKPAKKIDFEITNPGDVDIDDKGQIGLF